MYRYKAHANIINIMCSLAKLGSGTDLTNVLDGCKKRIKDNRGLLNKVPVGLSLGPIIFNVCTNAPNY